MEFEGHGFGKSLTAYSAGIEIHPSVFYKE